MRHRHDSKTLYKKHRNTIRSAAWKFNGLTGHDFDELHSEGNTIFMKAVASWKPAKGAFNTWLTLNLNTQLRRFTLKTDIPPAVEYEAEWEVSIRDGTDPTKPLEIREAIRRLAPEARMVAEMIVEGPAEALGLIGGETPKKVRGKLRDYLRGQGWSWAMIWSSYREIRAMLAMT